MDVGVQVYMEVAVGGHIKRSTLFKEPVSSSIIVGKKAHGLTWSAWNGTLMHKQFQN